MGRELMGWWVDELMSWWWVNGLMSWCVDELMGSHVGYLTRRWAGEFFYRFCTGLCMFYTFWCRLGPLKVPVSPYKGPCIALHTVALWRAHIALHRTRKKKFPPRVFGHNSWPRALPGTRIGRNGSYKPPGAPWTLQDPGEKPKTCYLEPEMS